VVSRQTQRGPHVILPLAATSDRWPSAEAMAPRVVHFAPTVSVLESTFLKEGNSGAENPTTTIQDVPLSDLTKPSSYLKGVVPSMLGMGLAEGGVLEERQQQSSQVLATSMQQEEHGVEEDDGEGQRRSADWLVGGRREDRRSREVQHYTEKGCLSPAATCFTQSTHDLWEDACPHELSTIFGSGGTGGLAATADSTLPPWAPGAQEMHPMIRQALLRLQAAGMPGAAAKLTPLQDLQDLTPTKQVGPIAQNTFGGAVRVMMSF